jgi:hypothetical protein
MLAAIDLDDDTPFEADEIGNEALKWDLPSEFESEEAASAQQPPHG